MDNSLILADDESKEKEKLAHYITIPKEVNTYKFLIAIH